MPEENLNWISLSEAQELMGRCKSTVRRLIRKHGIRTRKVLVAKGQELHVCLQDVKQLLPDDKANALQLTTTSSEPVAMVEQADLAEELQLSMTALAQAAQAQMNVLERLSVRLDTHNQERVDITETQRQLSDSLANINRTSKAQATAILEFGDRLKETNQARSLPVAVAVVCLIVGLAMGAMGVLYLSNGASVEEKIQKALNEERMQWKALLDQNAAIESDANASAPDVSIEQPSPVTELNSTADIDADEPGVAPSPAEVSKANALIVPDAETQKP